MIYFATFAMSLFALFLSGKCKGVLRGGLAAFGLVLPCLLAAYRDLSIGTDVMIYGIWTFHSASIQDIAHFMRSYSGISPLGFNLMSWTVANATHSFKCYLGVIQGLTVVPTYLALRSVFRGREWIGMLAYYCLLFQLSLNAMKQSIAIAFCFLAIVFAMRRKLLPFLSLTAVAVSFHQTAIIALFAYPLYSLVRKGKDSVSLFGRWRGLVLIVLLTIILGLIFVFGQQLVLFFSQFKDSYEYQVAHIGNGSTNKSIVVIAVAAFLAWWFGRPMVAFPSQDRTTAVELRSNGQSLVMYDYSALLFLIACILMQLDIVSTSVGRLGYYYLPAAGLFLSCLVFCSNGRTWYIAVLLASVFCFYFIYAFIILPGGQIYPYITATGLVLY